MSLFGISHGSGGTVVGAVVVVVVVLVVVVVVVGSVGGSAVVVFESKITALLCFSITNDWLIAEKLCHKQHI